MAFYVALFPELRQEIRSRSSRVTCCMFAMTCKAEWAAADPQVRGKLPEWFAREGIHQVCHFLRRFGVRSVLKEKEFYSYALEDGAKMVPYPFVCRLWHAALEWEFEDADGEDEAEDFTNVKDCASSLFYVQQQTTHSCHLCFRAAVRSKSVDRVLDLFSEDGTKELWFPWYTLGKGRPDEKTEDTCSYFKEEIVFTYAFYENDPLFLRQLLEQLLYRNGIRRLNAQIQFDQLDPGVYHIPIREIELLDSVAVLQGEGFSYAMEFLRENLIYGMIQQHWSPTEIERTLERYSIGDRIIDGCNLETDVIYLANYLEFCIGCFNPTAARFFWNKANSYFAAHSTENYWSEYKTALADARRCLQRSGLPEFVAILAEDKKAS